MLNPDGNRVVRLMKIVSVIFLGMYFFSAMHKWYRMETAPETVSVDAVSPFVDMSIIAVVILSYGIYKLIAHYRNSDERDFMRKYQKGK